MRDGEQQPIMETEKRMRPPSRRSEVASFIVMDVMQRAASLEAQGHSIIHMEVGQPGTPAPQAARDAVSRALARETLGYTLATGLPQLKERIARHYAEYYNVAVAPERIIITTGSSAGFVLSFLALFDAGARVALPAPGYPCYRHILSSLGCSPVIVDTGPLTRWMPTLDQIAHLTEQKAIDGLLVASPANPTGTMIEPKRLEELCQFCARNSVSFISDEIYHGLSYGEREATALRFSADAIVINSFSKFFSMTGWRVGWIVVPERLVRTVERLQQNLFISAPAVSQVAALGAFEGMDELLRNKRTYGENRALLLRELKDAGFRNLAPADGAFYIYADVSAFTDDARAFAQHMLEETGVAATPGIDFDEARGHHFIRFSYAGTTADMHEAARRLKAWPRLSGKGRQSAECRDPA
jgi:aspartate/methionine/tyrosine aminotransferase